MKRDRKKVKDPITGKSKWIRANRGLLRDYNGFETQIDSTKKYADTGKQRHIHFGNTVKTVVPRPKLNSLAHHD